jgi:hypothetical protein
MQNLRLDKLLDRKPGRFVDRPSKGGGRVDVHDGLGGQFRYQLIGSRAAPPNPRTSAPDLLKPAEFHREFRRAFAGRPSGLSERRNP